MSEVRWLNENEQRAWRGYVAMKAQLSARLNRHLQADSGLSEPDFAVLVNLSEAPEHSMRAFQLGAALQWEKSRLSHQLARMEQRGLVVRTDCPSDARGAYFRLTERGLSIIEAAAPLHVEAVREYLIDVLSAEQLEALTEIAETVLKRLKEY